MNRYYDERIIAAQPLGGHKLNLTFEDGFSATLDLAPLLECGPIFAPLRDPLFFARVAVLTDWGTIEWPGGPDLSPGSLRAWGEAGRFMDYDETNAWIDQHTVAAEKVA
jgi:hypothetical protein